MLPDIALAPGELHGTLSALAHDDRVPSVLCRKFPWDKQQLLIQLKYDHDTILLNTTSTLVPSASHCTASVHRADHGCFG